MKKTAPLLLFLFGVLFCTPSPGESGVLSRGYHIMSGKVRLEEPLVVPRGATLYVAPGTEIFVSLKEREEVEGVVQVIIVAGKIVLDGRKGAPVTISGEKAWGEIYLEEATGVVRNVEVENAAWAFHIHDSTVVFLGARIQDCGGGIRTNGVGVYVYDSEISRCDIALRYLHGGPVVRRSILTGNRVGIFFREGESSALFRGNTIISTEYAVKVGDFATGYPDVAGNYWGTVDTGELMEKVFDGRGPAFPSNLFVPLLREPLR